jgi:hypothetical protein
LAKETLGSNGSGIKKIFTEARQTGRMGMITEDTCDQFAGRSVDGFIADFAGHNIVSELKKKIIGKAN